MSQETTPDTTKAVEVKKAAVVEVSESGYLVAKDIEGRYRMAKVLYDSGMAPKSYDGPAQIMVAMEFAIELGLRPFQGIRNIAVINGSPSIYGELPLALARKTNQLEGIEEFLIDKDYNRISFENKNLHAEPWAAVCQIKRKAQPMVEAFFSLEDAKTAGLLGKTGPWKSYPKVMLIRRARSQALKTAFADALAGISIAEYDFNYLPEGSEARDVTREGVAVVDNAKALNQLFDEPITQ